jgi:hypothetical protein
MEHDVDKETECETRDVEWSAHPPRKFWSALLRATMQSPAYGFFQDYPSSKECTMHMVLRTYEASQMGMRLARLAAIVSPTIHEGHQPGMGDEGRIESEMQPAMRRR